MCVLPADSSEIATTTWGRQCALHHVHAYLLNSVDFKIGLFKQASKPSLWWLWWGFVTQSWNVVNIPSIGRPSRRRHWSWRVTLTGLGSKCPKLVAVDSVDHDIPTGPNLRIVHLTIVSSLMRLDSHKYHSGDVVIQVAKALDTWYGH